MIVDVVPNLLMTCVRHLLSSTNFIPSLLHNLNIDFSLSNLNQFQVQANSILEMRRFLRGNNCKPPQTIKIANRQSHGTNGAVDELSSMILERHGLQIEDFGRHWKEKVFPGWCAQNYQRAFLEPIAQVFKCLHDCKIQVDIVNYHIVTTIAVLIEENLQTSAGHVLRELLVNQQNTETDHEATARAMLYSSEVEQEEDSKQTAAPDIGKFPQVVGDGEDETRFVASLSPDDLVWKTKIWIQFPEGLHLFPSALAFLPPIPGSWLPRASTLTRAGLSVHPAYRAYITEAMVHQIRPGYSVKMRANIEQQILQNDPMIHPSSQLCYQRVALLARHWSRDTNLSKWPSLIDLEATLNFFLYKPSKHIRDIFISMKLGDLPDYETKLIINEDANDGRGSVTVQRSGRVLTVTLEVHQKQTPTNNRKRKASVMNKGDEEYENLEDEE